MGNVAVADLHIAVMYSDSSLLKKPQLTLTWLNRSLYVSVCAYGNCKCSSFPCLITERRAKLQFCRDFCISFLSNHIFRTLYERFNGSTVQMAFCRQVKVTLRILSLIN